MLGIFSFDEIGRISRYSEFLNFVESGKVVQTSGATSPAKGVVIFYFFLTTTTRKFTCTTPHHVFSDPSPEPACSSRWPPRFWRWRPASRRPGSSSAWAVSANGGRATARSGNHLLPAISVPTSPRVRTATRTSLGMETARRSSSMARRPPSCPTSSLLKAIR